MSNEITFNETELPNEVPADGGGNGRRGRDGTATRAADLSEEIARAVTRSHGERVTCRRVGDHHYRCNWWTPQSTAAYDNPAMEGSLVMTSRISQSQFLHVTKSGRELKIRVDTRTAPRRRFAVGG